jgi:hypothetical protein
MGSICLLAPVPEEHLRSGLITLQQVDKVAFGSRAWEVFRKLDSLIEPAKKCEALVYASDASIVTSSPMVTWRATYVGHTESVNGRHRDGMKYRPESTGAYTRDNQGHWAIFWEVEDLCPMEKSEYLPIAELLGYDQPRRYLKNFIPRGPLVVEKA